MPVQLRAESVPMPLHDMGSVLTQPAAELAGQLNITLTSVLNDKCFQTLGSLKCGSRRSAA